MLNCMWYWNENCLAFDVWLEVYQYFFMKWELKLLIEMSWGPPRGEVEMKEEMRFILESFIVFNFNFRILNFEVRIFKKFNSKSEKILYQKIIYFRLNLWIFRYKNFISNPIFILPWQLIIASKFSFPSS